jgi:hypothetical protein
LYRAANIECFLTSARISFRIKIIFLTAFIMKQLAGK